MSKMNFSWKTLGMIVIPLAIIMLIFENNQNLEMKKETNVYKILTQEEWLISKKNGYITTDLDIKDGFIHLSTAKQLAATLYYFFKKDESLILIQFNSNDLGSKLVFETVTPLKFPFLSNNASPIKSSIKNLCLILAPRPGVSAL